MYRVSDIPSLGPGLLHLVHECCNIIGANCFRERNYKVNGGRQETRCVHNTVNIMMMGLLTVPSARLDRNSTAVLARTRSLKSELLGAVMTYASCEHRTCDVARALL